MHEKIKTCCAAACMIVFASLAALPVLAETENSTPVSAPLAIVTLHHSMQLAATMVLDGVDGASVRCIAHAGSDCCETQHFTPDDLKALALADAVIVGAAGDPTLSGLIRPGARIIDATAGIPFMASTVGSASDPHIWMSPLMFGYQIDVLAVQLGELRPELAEALRANARKAGVRLAELTASMREAFSRVPSPRVVAYHDAFSSLSSDLGIAVVAVMQEGDQDPTPSRLADTIRIMRETNTGVILVEEGGTGAETAAMVAKEVGAVVCSINTLQSGPVTPDAYIDVMQANTESLLAAFGSAPASAPNQGK